VRAKPTSTCAPVRPTRTDLGLTIASHSLRSEQRRLGNWWDLPVPRSRRSRCRVGGLSVTIVDSGTLPEPFLSSASSGAHRAESLIDPQFTSDARSCTRLLKTPQPASRSASRSSVEPFAARSPARGCAGVPRVGPFSVAGHRGPALRGLPPLGTQRDEGRRRRGRRSLEGVLGGAT